MSKQRYAPLTAGLLARKGEAAPALRGFMRQAMEPAPDIEHDLTGLQDTEVPAMEGTRAADRFAAAAPLEGASALAERSDHRPPGGALTARDIRQLLATEEARDGRKAGAETSGDGKSVPPVGKSEGRAAQFAALIERSRPSVMARQKAAAAALPPASAQADELPASEGQPPAAAPQPPAADARSADGADLEIEPKRARVSVRLDPGRYVRMKVAAAKLGLTNQDLVTAALDQYFENLDEDVLGSCSLFRDGII